MPAKRRIGTDADTPHSLRMKAAEFRRLAEAAKDAETMEDLLRLAAAYEDEARAQERERCGD
jgi:hypothetical protein